ncbi:MAG: hypothetical protein AAF502_03405 [Bacteroidota bacterium]
MSKTIKKKPAGNLWIILGIIFRILFFLAVGIILNVLFGLFLLFSETSATYTLKIVLLVMFLGVLPLYYIWKARGQAVTIGIRQVYIGGEGLIKRLVKSATTSVINRIDDDEDEEATSITDKLVNGAAGLAKRTEKLPLILRWVVGLFFDRIPLTETLSEVTTDLELKTENIDEISNKVFDKVDDYVKDELLNAGLGRFWTFLGLNLLGMAAVYYYLIY